MDTIEDIISTLKKIARKEHNVRLRQRYDVVRLFFQGHRKKEIASIMNLSLPTIYKILECYTNKGLEGLVPGDSTGRNKKLTEEQEAILYKTISEKTPNEAGLAPFCNWTAPLACQFVENKFHTEFSERGMRNVFYRLGLSYTRPTYVLANADPEKQEKFCEEAEALKKLLNEEIAHLLYEDESMIRDYQAIMKTWFPIGKQRIIPTYGKHEGVKLVGTLNYETGEVYVEEHKSYDAEVFHAFLQHILDKYPSGKIVMILDNARIHHAKLLNDFLTENPRLQLKFLPPYSPNLNKIEELWRWLKDSVIHNVFFHKRGEIQKAVNSFIAWVNTVPFIVIDRLCL